MRVQAWLRLGVIMLTAVATSAAAQTVSPLSMSQKVDARIMAAAKKIQDACTSDVTKFCSTVTPGDGRLILCMMAHEDKISGKCDYAIYEAVRNTERALDRIEILADACWADIETHCATVSEGGGRIAQCLMTKKASLSKECTGTIDKIDGKN
jgi:hypothetical protein